MHVDERRHQAGASLEMINNSANGKASVFMGDLNWGDTDGILHLPISWSDAWTVANGNQDGFTYNSRINKMLSGSLRSRCDRILSKKLLSTNVELVGTSAIDGVTFMKKERGVEKMKPVFPSDHFGVLATFNHLPATVPT